MRTTLVIGTRGSALALKQADIARQALLAAEPTLRIEIRVVTTRGDVDSASIPLDVVGKGWFTKEVEQALLETSIDVAVHSLKDLPEELPDGLAIGAYLPREDARDVLITRDNEPLEDVKPGAVIGTDSIRRQLQMRALRPDVRIESVRGNVPTRLEKLAAGPYDALILAAAGIKRLGLDGRITRYFEPHEMTPAPGQGILAVEARQADTDLVALLASLSDKEASHAARIERSFSRMMGDGCKAPTGAYAFREADACMFLGMTADATGNIMRKETRAPWYESDTLGEQLAEQLLHEREHHAQRA